MNRKGSNVSGRSYNLLLAVAAVWVGLFVVSTTNAQLSGRPDRGFQAGNSYAISDIERINLTGGGVGMTIPLASLPKGRGTAPGFSISISYDSKIWDSAQKWENDALQPTYSNPERYDYPRNLLIPSEDGGWQFHISYKLNVIYRNRGNIYEPAPEEKCLPFNDNYSKNGYAFKVEMKLPGGGSTIFRPFGSGHHYEDFHKDGFYEINPNGQAHHRHLTTIVNDPDLGTYASCGDTFPQIDTNGMDYYAQDGSGIRLFIPYSTTHSATESDRPWIMYFSDGTVVENKPADDTSTFQRITDANGNRVKMQNGTYNGLSGLKIVDDTGRFIFKGGWPEQKIYQTGVDGEVLETTLNWKSEPLTRSLLSAFRSTRNMKRSSRSLWFLTRSRYLRKPGR